MQRQTRITERSAQKVTPQKSRSSSSRESKAIQPLLALQNRLGNKAVSQTIQQKPENNGPGNHCEREANRLAQQVVQRRQDGAMSNTISPSPLIDGGFQGLADPSGLTKDQEWNFPMTMAGGGEPMPAETRLFFESTFQRNFQQVRIHKGGNEAEAAAAMKARAFTTGKDIVFSQGGFAPQTLKGMELLAHELVHVMQQTGRQPIIQRHNNGEEEGSGTPAQHRVDQIVARLEGYTSAADSRFILSLFQGLSPSEQRAVIHELAGRAEQMHESANGPLFRLFEDLEEEDRTNLALLLLGNGVLSDGQVLRLLAGRTWAGRWLPVTTEAGAEAAQFYADLIEEGSRQGGFGGFLEQAGGYLGGFFASLWTPETASETILALTAARYAEVFPRAVGAPLAVVGSAQTGLSIGALITGMNLNAEPLTEEDRLRHWILAVTGIIVIAGGTMHQFGGRSRGSIETGAGETSGRVLTPEEVADFHSNNVRVGEFTTNDGVLVEVYAPRGTSTTGLTIPENLPRPLPPPPRPRVLALPPAGEAAPPEATGGRTTPPETTAAEPLEPHPVSLEGPLLERPLELAPSERATVPEALEPHPAAGEGPLPEVLPGADVGTYGRAGTEFHLYTTAEVAFGMRTNFDPITRLPRAVEYYQMAPTEGVALPPRPRRFPTGEMIPREYQLRHETYTGTEYERGHLMPREAAASYPEALEDIDVMSNIAPMFGRGARGINQSVWRGYEMLASEQAQQFGIIRVRIEVIRAQPSATPVELSEVCGYTRTHYDPDGNIILGVSVPNE